MTLPEIARQAARTVWNEPTLAAPQLIDEIADAVLLAVLQELIKEATSNQHRNPRCWLEEIHAVVSALLGVRRDEQGLEKKELMRVPETRESSEPLTHASTTEPRTSTSASGIPPECPECGGNVIDDANDDPRCKNFQCAKCGLEIRPDMAGTEPRLNKEK